MDYICLILSCFDSVRLLLFRISLGTEAVSSSPLASLIIPFYQQKRCSQNTLLISHSVSIESLCITCSWKIMVGSKNTAYRFLKIRGEISWQIFRTGLTQLHSVSHLQIVVMFLFCCFFFLNWVLIKCMSVVVIFVLAKYLLHVKELK